MTPEHPSGLDDGLSPTGRPRLDVPALASLYVQPLTPMGTVENQRAATAFGATAPPPLRLRPLPRLWCTAWIALSRSHAATGGAVIAR